MRIEYTQGSPCFLRVYSLMMTDYPANCTSCFQVIPFQNCLPQWGKGKFSLKVIAAIYKYFLKHSRQLLPSPTDLNFMEWFKLQAWSYLDLHFLQGVCKSPLVTYCSLRYHLPSPTRIVSINSTELQSCFPFQHLSGTNRICCHPDFGSSFFLCSSPRY